MKMKTWTIGIYVDDDKLGEVEVTTTAEAPKKTAIDKAYFKRNVWGNADIQYKVLKTKEFDWSIKESSGKFVVTVGKSIDKQFVSGNTSLSPEYPDAIIFNNENTAVKKAEQMQRLHRSSVIKVVQDYGMNNEYAPWIWTGESTMDIGKHIIESKKFLSEAQASDPRAYVKAWDDDVTDRLRNRHATISRNILRIAERNLSRLSEGDDQYDYFITIGQLLQDMDSEIHAVVTKYTKDIPVLPTIRGIGNPFRR